MLRKIGAFFERIFSGIKGSFMRHKVIWIGGVIIVIAAIVVAFVFLRPSSNATNLLTAKVNLGNLQSTTSATGTVQSNQSAVLAWQTTGEIGQVYVKIGDKVGADQVLADLTTSSLPQNIILAQSDLVTAQQDLDNVKNSTITTAQAQLALANAQKAVTDAQNRVTSTAWARGSQDQIDAADAQRVLAKAALQKAQDFFNIYKNVDPSNPLYASAYSQLANAQQRYDTAQANLDYVTGHYSSSEAAISAANLAVAQAQYNDALRQWNLVKDGPTQSNIAAAQAKVDAAQATLNMAHLIAPFAGMITEVNSSVGDQVSPGTKSIRIDDLSHYLINIQVSEMDVAKIKVGQPATITFDAIANKTYNGKVVSVAQAGEVSQGVANFSVSVEVTNPDTQVLPGMTSAVNVVTNQLTNVLIVPNRSVRQVNGRSVVYVFNNGRVAPVTVVLGASSDTYSEVVSGNLKAGDTIVLNPTAITSTSSLFQAAAGANRGGFSGGGGGFSGGGAPSGGGTVPSGGTGTNP